MRISGFRKGLLGPTWSRCWLSYQILEFGSQNLMENVLRPTSSTHGIYIGEVPKHVLVHCREEQPFSSKGLKTCSYHCDIPTYICSITPPDWSPCPFTGGFSFSYSPCHLVPNSCWSSGMKWSGVVVKVWRYVPIIVIFSKCWGAKVLIRKSSCNLVQPVPRHHQPSLVCGEHSNTYWISRLLGLSAQCTIVQ